MSSKIEWTEATWNPVVGCSKISAGCKNCYAVRMSVRLDSMGLSKYQDVASNSSGKPLWTGRVALDEPSLKLPDSRKAPTLFFVNSMSDLFHPELDFGEIEKVWNVMRRNPQHTFQILTKRPDRMVEFASGLDEIIPSNIWLGTSVECRKYIGRLDWLRKIDCSVRFVSFEPLIGPIGSVDLSGVAWAIVGGEAGPQSRVIKREWVTELRDQCDEQSVRFFFKQWGGSNKKKSGRTLDGRTYDEMPQLYA